QGCGLFLGAFVQRAQIGMLHFVQALDLVDDQLRIAVDAQPFDPAGRGVIERRDQRVIFGDVVGRAANIFSEGFVRCPIGAPQDYSVGCRTGIPARRAIYVCGIRAFLTRRRRYRLLEQFPGRFLWGFGHVFDRVFALLIGALSIVMPTVMDGDTSSLWVGASAPTTSPAT